MVNTQTNKQIYKSNQSSTVPRTEVVEYEGKDLVGATDERALHNSGISLSGSSWMYPVEFKWHYNIIMIM